MELRRRQLEQAALDEYCRRPHLCEHGNYVHTEVLGRVGRETPLGLHELPLGAHSVAAPGLVPGDRDVDEPLIEVALAGRRRTPCRLELLVRREELAAADQLEPALKRRP